MARWITSDLHLQHKNIREYCPESRGHYPCTDSMNQGIIGNINNHVAEDDELIIVGDIGFGTPLVIMELLKQINGSKILVWGNHDFRLRKSDEFAAMHRLAGVIWSGDIYYSSQKIDGVTYPLHIQHFPLLDWNDMSFCGIALHGHRHSKKGCTDTYDEHTRSMDIGCDGNDLNPYNLEDIVRMMAPRKPRYRGHHDGTPNRRG